MNIMAIEDGLFPLAYVTHTIKYLQQCKIFLLNRNTRTKSAKLHQLIVEVIQYQYGEGRRWQKAQRSRQMLTNKVSVPAYFCVRPSGLHVLGVTSTLFTVFHEWRNSTCGTMAQMKEKQKKNEARTKQHSTPHGSARCRHRFFTVTFLEDKVELNNTSSLSHISLKHMLRHLNVCLLRET